MEERGFDAIFVPEHTHFPATPTSFLDPDGVPLPERYRHIYDPFVTLAAAAAVTTTLKLGTSACVVPLHDVVQLAKTVATLDRVSGGRVVLGAGAGWNAEELRTHGVDPARRGAILTEALIALSLIWSEDEPSFDGDHVRFGPIWSWPKPVQRPRPHLLVAGNSKAAIERVLAHADGWLPSHRGGEGLGDRVAELRSRADELGRPRPTVTFVAPDADAATLERCHAAGVDRFLAPIRPGSRDDTLAALDRHVEAWTRFRG